MLTSHFSFPKWNFDTKKLNFALRNEKWDSNEDSRDWSAALWSGFHPCVGSSLARGYSRHYWLGWVKQPGEMTGDQVRGIWSVNGSSAMQEQRGNFQSRESSFESHFPFLRAKFNFLYQKAIWEMGNEMWAFWNLISNFLSLTSHFLYLAYCLITQLSFNFLFPQWNFISS